MPRLLILKDGEIPELESPEMPLATCQEQEQIVGRMISARHTDTSSFIERTDDFDGVGSEGPNSRDAWADLGWIEIAAHVVRDVKIVKGGKD